MSGYRIRLPSLIHRLPLAVLAAGMVGVPAAANDFSVHGTVPATCFVSVSEDRDVIDLNQEGGAVMLGAVGEGCNVPVGYLVTLSSANGGSLIDGDGNKLPYTISYGALDGQSLTRPRTINHLDPRPKAQTEALRLSLATGKTARHGLFSDTVVITVLAR